MRYEQEVTNEIHGLGLDENRPEPYPPEYWLEYDLLVAEIKTLARCKQVYVTMRMDHSYTVRTSLRDARAVTTKDRLESLRRYRDLLTAPKA